MKALHGPFFPRFYLNGNDIPVFLYEIIDLCIAVERFTVPVPELLLLITGCALENFESAVLFGNSPFVNGFKIFFKKQFGKIQPEYTLKNSGI